MVVVASKLTWIVRLLEVFGATNLKPITLECDNKSAMQMAHNPVQHHRTKHIAIDCQFTRKKKILEGLRTTLYSYSRLIS